MQGRQGPVAPRTAPRHVHGRRKTIFSNLKTAPQTGTALLREL
jgi:hypothetical protein